MLGVGVLLDRPPVLVTASLTAPWSEEIAVVPGMFVIGDDSCAGSEGRHPAAPPPPPKKKARAVVCSAQR